MIDIFVAKSDESEVDWEKERSQGWFQGSSLVTRRIKLPLTEKGKAQVRVVWVKNQGFDFCGHVKFGKPSKWRCQVGSWI